MWVHLPSHLVKKFDFYLKTSSAQLKMGSGKVFVKCNDRFYVKKLAKKLLPSYCQVISKVLPSYCQLIAKLL